MENLQQEEDGFLNLENHDVENHDDSEDSFTEEKDIIASYTAMTSNCLSHAIYHVDWLNFSENSSKSVSSLIYLCCKEIIRDANFLKSVSAYLPINRFDLLMTTAICDGSCVHSRSDSAAALMSCWPRKSMSVSAIDADELLRHIFYQHANFAQLLAKKLLFVWKQFLCGVKNDSMQRLRVLDLRGVPLDDAMLNFFLRGIMNLPAEIHHSNDYHIIIDCVLYKAYTLRKLTTFLINANLIEKKYKIQLRINAIDVTGLNETLCWILFRTINPADLVGLRTYSLFSSKFYTYIFTKFSLLKNLDVAIHDLKSSKNEMQIQLLPNLRRLGYNLELEDFPTAVPVTVLSTLECFESDMQEELGLDRVIERKLQYMISTPLILRELILTGTEMMEKHLNLWRDLLRSLVSTLTILDLDSCLRDEILLPSLISFILPLINLQYLNLIPTFFINLETLFEYTSQLLLLPQLKTLRIGVIDERDTHLLSEKIFNPLKKKMALKQFPVVIVRFGSILLS